jgi:2-amino-4-hydroxy-6-hydroxymethyldihydropteridine diphosphokinase
MILIALGANLPAADGSAPLASCRAAAEALRGLPGLRLQALSRWYLTAPVLRRGGAPDGQPPYVNGVVRLEGWMEPAALLARLHAIETRAGRRRDAVDAPRTLDLDIIAMNGLVRDAPDPVLPHPRAHERAFVLRPLLEVAPEWVHPRLHRSGANLLAALPEQKVALA